MYREFSDFMQSFQHICVIQAENPDGDSLGAALALESAFPDKIITLYCPVDIPKYMRYFEGWSRVTNEFPYKAEAYVIVDTVSATLLSKLLNDSAIQNRLYHAPVFAIDHHETAPDLDFEFQFIIEPLSSTCVLLYKILQEQKIPIDSLCAENLLYGILSDTLGLTSPSTTADDYRAAAALIDFGAKIAEMEERRRDYSKKSPRILDYKADLIKRIQYDLEGQLATVLIPFEDIQNYSDEYNPNVLILEELRLVEGVKVAIAIKTYPDGKLTGKIRTTIPIAEQIAAFFGGGGHPYAAGFRIYDGYDNTINQLIGAVDQLIRQYELEASHHV